MTQGISSGRDDLWGVLLAQNDGPPPPKAGPVGDDLFDYPDPVLTPQLPRPLLAPAAVGGPTPAGDDARVQAGLDAFRQTMNQPYRTPEGLSWPGTPFRMATPYARQVPLLKQTAVALARASAASHLSADQFLQLRVGRASAEVIHVVTQALIDQGSLPAPSDPPLGMASRIRIMMFNHGIGIDCAGYVRQAYLHAMRASEAAARFSGIDDDLSNLAPRGYTRVTDVACARPGDIVVLGPPPNEPGHRAIVYEQHLASSAEIDDLRRWGGAGARMGEAGGPIRIVEVDSSWGSGGNPLLGGVRRETWWYSETTGTWAWVREQADGPGTLHDGATPLAHPFASPFGIFRGHSHAGSP